MLSNLSILVVNSINWLLAKRGFKVVKIKEIQDRDDRIGHIEPKFHRLRENLLRVIQCIRAADAGSTSVNGHVLLMSWMEVQHIVEVTEPETSDRFVVASFGAEMAVKMAQPDSDPSCVVREALCVRQDDGAWMIPASSL